MKIEDIFIKVRDKHYYVEYQHNGENSWFNGFLLHYNGGTAVFYNDHGIYHLQMSDIKFMRPLLEYEVEQIAY